MSKKLDIQKLRQLQAVSAASFLALAVVAGLVLKAVTYQLSLGFITRDDLASRNTTVFAPAFHFWYDIDVRWLLVVILVLSSILPILWLTRLGKNYAQSIQRGELPLRWLDLAITGALMIETVGILSGMHDIVGLKLLGAVVAIGYVLAWMADRQNKSSKQPQWSAFITGLVSQALAVLALVAYTISTLVYSLVRSPWYVYALLATVVAMMALVGLNQYVTFRTNQSKGKFLSVERNYIAINLAAKAVFALILIIGLKR